MLTQGALAEKPAVLAAQNQAPVTLEGRLENVTISARGNVSAILCTNSLGVDARILVRLPEGVKAGEGQLAAVSGDLVPLDRARNPGAFDEFLYWRARKADAKMYVDEATLGDVTFNLHSALFALREKMTAAFHATLPEKEAGVLNAMITGDKAGIDAEIGTLYRDAGIYHIIAVSGTHMTILAMVINWILSRFEVSRKKSALIAFAVIVLYCIFTGASAPAVRSVLMFGMVAFAPFVRRDADTISSACFAAIVLLACSPLYLWDVGFLYSFAAVLALAIGTNASERGLIKLFRDGKAPLFVLWLIGKKGVRQAICSAIAVFLVTWPLTAWFFYSVSPISILANILIVPAVTLLTISGFVTGLLGMISAPLGMLAANPAFVILKAYEWLCRALVSIPFANILTGRPPFWLLAMYLAALALAFSAMHKDGMAYARRKRISLIAGGLFLAGFWVFYMLPKPLTVAMLDVGQGDALVLSRGKTAMIWDGGGHANKDLGDNTGNWVVLPYLRYLGIARADAVLTHPDADHALGIVEAMDAGVVRRLFLADGVAPDGDIATLVLERAAANNVSVEFIRAGDWLPLLPDTQILCLHPPENGGAAGNSGSIVCRVDYGETSFLLTGDADAESEAQMLAIDPAALDVDVLKLGHHGSNTSSTEAFLRAVSPELAAASAGRNNRYGHPAQLVMERLEAIGISLVVTANQGAILFETDGQRLTTRCILE